MTWTAPNYVGPGEASSAQFNAETVDNLLHLHDRIDGGSVTDDTDIDGNVFVTHNLGATPIVVVCSPSSRAPSAWVGVPHLYTSTTFAVRVVRVSDAALITNATVSFRWLAFRI